MKIIDFAELQKFYTGATNKRKWVITNPEILMNYFEKCGFKPSILSKKLNTSYATVKRFLCSSNLWDKAIIKKQNNKGGRKRTTSADKFGYKYADSKYDYINERGEIIRRSEHHVVAEEKIGRKLLDRELVHHVNLIKTDNNPDNIFVCQSNNQHRKLHCQLETVAAEAMKYGIIKFDQNLGYFLDLKIVNAGNK